MEETTKYRPAALAWFRNGWWQDVWNSLARVRVRRKSRELRLCESLSLGEKRVVAVIQYEGQRFLISAGAQSVNLLCRLDAAAEFPELLSQWCERQR